GDAIADACLGHTRHRRAGHPPGGASATASGGLAAHDGACRSTGGTAMTANAVVPRLWVSLLPCLAALLPMATACHAGSSGPASIQQGGDQVAETTAASGEAEREGAQWTAQ